MAGVLCEELGTGVADDILRYLGVPIVLSRRKKKPVKPHCYHVRRKLSGSPGHSH